MSNPLRHSLSVALVVSMLGVAGSADAARPRPARPIEEQGWIPGPNGPIWASYTVDTASNAAVYQGDMTFRLDGLRAYQSELPDAPSDIVVHASLEIDDSWPDGVIPYEIVDLSTFQARPVSCGTGCTETQLQAIQRAIDHWNEETDLELVPRSNESYWVRIVADREGKCHADVGNQANLFPDWFLNDDPQRIHLADWCGFGGIVHEIGHTVGFRHEQSRPDRDSYVTVHAQNITEGDEDNFDKKGRSWGDYNYGSIMHYPRDAFSLGADTIVPVVPLPQDVLGQRDGLSKGDIAAANALAARGRGVSPVPNGYRDLSSVGANLDGLDPDYVHTADVDGDGRDDLVQFTRAGGDVLVGMGRHPDDYPDYTVPRAFSNPTKWHDSFCAGYQWCAAGDVDGDGRADVVSVDQLTDEVLVARSTGTSFSSTGELWADYASSLPLGELHLADVNGDCKDDAVFLYWWVSDEVDVTVALSTGNGFGPLQARTTIDAAQLVGFARVDLDAREDLVVSDAAGNVWLHASTGNGFGPYDYLLGDVCRPGNGCAIGDMNGDAVADLAIFHDQRRLDGTLEGAVHHLGRVRVLPGAFALVYDPSLGYDVYVPGFDASVVTYHEVDCKNDQMCSLADPNGDGFSDVVESFGLAEGPGPGDLLFVSENTGLWHDGLSNSPPAPLQCTPTASTPSALWTRISTFAVDRVAATSSELFVRHAGDRRVYRHQGGTSWRSQSDPVGHLVATRDHVFATGPASDYVIERTAERTWAGITGPVRGLFGGPSGVFTIGSDGNTWAFDCVCDGWFGTLPGWTYLRQGGIEIAVGGLTRGDDAAPWRRHLFQLDSAGAVRSFRFDTRQWTSLGGNVDHIWAGGGWVYGTNPSTGYLYGYDPAVQQWYWISHASTQFAVDQETGTLYRLRNDRIERWTGTVGSWVRVGESATRIFVAQGRLFKTSPSTGELFELQD